MIAGGHDTHSGAFYPRDLFGENHDGHSYVGHGHANCDDCASHDDDGGPNPHSDGGARSRPSRRPLHRRRDDAKDDSDNDSDIVDDDVEPLVVCDGVSVRAFNEYVGDGEGLRIGVRFLQLEADDRLLLVEFPTWVHEATVDQFQDAFLDASGTRYAINRGGSFTAERSSFLRKEADATFGPLANTPNRSPKPSNITRAGTVCAVWWYHYPGVQYLLLLKIPESARMLMYALYGVVRNPLQPDGDLPHPVVSDAVVFLPNGPQPPVNISFDARRILSIPRGQPLPAGVHDSIVVDLRVVLTRVYNSCDLR